MTNESTPQPPQQVLLVDDTPANIDVLRKTLQLEGYDILVAQSGEIALKLVERALPDLILLDIMMPGIDGYETCRQLKENAATRHIPIIFITAKTETDDIVRGFEVGGVDYITKPFRRQEVTARVKAHLFIRSLVKRQECLISDLRLANEKLDNMARTDQLTGLSNRRDMTTLIEFEKARFERSRKAFVVVLGDVDFFKKINDTYGHDAGDYVLVQVSRLLRENIRKQDMAARWGGEEFILLLPETDLQGGMGVAEKVRQKIESEKLRFKEQDIKVTMSFGLSIFEDDMFPVEDCIKKADKRLYIAKKSGRNKCVAGN